MSGVASNLSELAAYHLAEEKRYMAIHSAMNTRQDEERAEPELCRMDADWRERIERLTAMRARTPAEIAAKSISAFAAQQEQKQEEKERNERGFRSG
jgi:hypothetical protein